jgi:hypothetical protein
MFVNGYLAEGETVAAPAAARPILDAISQLVAAGAATWQQVKLSDLNMKLVEQGKPPLTAAQAGAIAPQLNIGIAPDTQNILLIGLAGIGAFAALTMLSKRSRR